MSQWQRRRGERGFMMIDALVAISMVSISVLTLVFAFAQAEKLADGSTRAAGLEALMRQTGDALRARGGYVYCAAPSSYSGLLPAAPAGDTVTITAVTPVMGSTSNGAPLPAVRDCTTGGFISNTCPAGDVCDYGVQRLTVVVRDTGPPSSVTRVVYKGAH